MKIVFMGTPDFSVPCLAKLIESRHEVTGVFTQPDKPKGRHGELAPPPVKVLALENGIKVYQPVKMRDGTALEMLREASPDLIIVVAYGKILPKEILEYPKYGCINIHASLLPDLRGAAPIQWAILRGLKETGVTAMQMDEGLDTGDMLLKEKVEITENMNASELHDILSSLGADVMIKAIDLLEEGKLVPEKQGEAESFYAGMLSKDLSPIDWSKSALEVHNQVRGLYGWPCATAKLGGKTFKIHETVLTGEKGNAPGEIVDSHGRLSVCCGDLNCVEIKVLQAENKKAMKTEDYLRGNPVTERKFD
ncbi:MAG: methionyl-tRNA formyltransferase [Clostridia bacterium]|nr:methionyl-tRNA formyltransferase [Clostridia bacterium]